MLKYRYRYLSLCICFYNNTTAQTNERAIILQLFNALSTDASVIKIRLYHQELLSLEFNFHYQYSRHSDSEKSQGVYQVTYHTDLASGRRLSYILSVECVVVENT